MPLLSRRVLVLYQEFLDAHRVHHEQLGIAHKLSDKMVCFCSSNQSFFFAGIGSLVLANDDASISQLETKGS